MIDLVNSKTEALKRYLARAEKVHLDKDRTKRLAAQKCQLCYYEPRQQTNSGVRDNCKICNKLMTWGSSDIPALCKDCAKVNNLCIHCSASLELKVKKKVRTETHFMGVCEICEETKLVEETIDPYTMDVYGREVEITVCQECYDNRNDDI